MNNVQRVNIVPVHRNVNCLGVSALTFDELYGESSTRDDESGMHKKCIHNK